MSFDDSKTIKELACSVHMKHLTEQWESFSKFVKALKDPLPDGEIRDMKRMCLYTEAVLRDQIFLADAFAILDYSDYGDGLPPLPEEESLKKNSFFFATVDQGGSEGVYLDIYFEVTQSVEEYTKSRTVERHRIGTMKTLREDAEAYAMLGKLAGIIPTAYEQYISRNSQ